jgi:hypothetical protein
MYSAVVLSPWKPKIMTSHCAVSSWTVTVSRQESAAVAAGAAVGIGLPWLHCITRRAVNDNSLKGVTGVEARVTTLSVRVSVRLQLPHLLRLGLRIGRRYNGINVVHRIPVVCKSCHVVMLMFCYQGR